MVKAKTNEQPSEDPEILDEEATASRDLADFLRVLNIEVDFCDADWKDTQELVEGVRRLCLEHPSWSMYYFNGDTWGTDTNYVFFTSKPCEGEVVEKIGDYIVELGASLPEEIVPSKPKCPKCGKEIDGLIGAYPAVVGGYASILNGILDTQLNEDSKIWEIIDEDSAIWCCPLCDAELFKAGQEAEMTAFLLCDKEYKAEEKEKPFSSG